MDVNFENKMKVLYRCNFNILIKAHIYDGKLRGIKKSNPNYADFKDNVFIDVQLIHSLKFLKRQMASKQVCLVTI